MSDDCKQNLSQNSLDAFGNYENSDYEVDTELQELSQGMLLAGKYWLENQVGQGGMGVVWKAFDLIGSRRNVVLKFMPKEIRHNEDAMDQVKKTFKKIRRFHHSNICPVYALEKDGKFGYYVVMKWLKGLSLAEFREQKKFRQEMIFPILKPLAEALDYAHTQGVIHHGVNPGNIFLPKSEDGTIRTVQLSDFNLAAEILQADTAFHTFLQLKTSGSMAYMPPEQWEGNPQQQDARTDQYALAAVAYELYSGHLPFMAANPEMLRLCILQDPPEEIISAPAHVNSALQKALAKDRKDRFPSCMAFMNALSDPTFSVSLPTPVKTDVEMKKLREDAERRAQEKLEAERRPSEDPEPGVRMVKTINGVEFAFRWCPAGEFMMGSPSSEAGRDNDETQHRVTLTKGFWMLETQVTQEMWQSVMGNNPSRFKGNKLPVECVSLDDCQEFCQKLRNLGLNIQLPTEAQWEYACRAGTTGAYAGDLDSMAWYDSNSDSTTHAVGQKNPNAWGLYDMHGNVWEWCADWKGSYIIGSVTDPTGPAFGSYRVIRGGNWGIIARYCRSAVRGRDIPTYRGDFLGFRPVLVP
ncbi:MAG: bifunctional serine/threonine-protein kinase/formylglycine-generating enzyme family protein [Planctomycetia bacterium]|nr:bifunctional serine/threonine-protein kinase/formylglycine-generating enzyme family protein [Planctomycetia bacterium]